MSKNFSPWIHQLNKERINNRLNKDIETEVAIVGAGIAGTATAFYVLKNTDKKVTLLEKWKLGHGATGHNGGHALSEFERDFTSMVEEFGLELAAQGQINLDNSWELLDEMYTDASLDIPFSRFMGQLGLLTLDEVLQELKDSVYRKKGGVRARPIYIAENAPFLKEIPEEYKEFYTVIPQSEILTMLETKNEAYFAVVSNQSGCFNSALFCQEIIGYLLLQFPSRFSLYEHTPIDKIILRHEDALLDAETHTINAKRVVLCTNGFENLTIINESGLDIDARYHHLVKGLVGYMSGYLEEMNKPPTAIAYLEEGYDDFDDPYFYMTRRPYEYEKGLKHNLISIGGPQVSLEESVVYSYEDEYPEEKMLSIEKFIDKTYLKTPRGKFEHIFTWHGLMGLTKNGIRMVGPEPQNQSLLYNLGCNGIGLLPSIYGGKKIARHIAGEKVEKSIFDVPLR